MPIIMAGAPKVDRSGPLDEVLRNLDSLSHPAKAAFAVRCAWRSTPLLVCGWKSESDQEIWLHHNLQIIQLAAFAALIAVRAKGQIEIPEFAFSLEHIGRPDSEVAALSLKALDDAALWARAVWVATPMKAAEYSIDAYMACFSDSRRETTAQAILQAMQADLFRLQDGIEPSAIFDFPILNQTSEDAEWPLRDVDARWHEIIPSVDSAPEFWESLKRIWHGQPDWNHIESGIRNWIGGVAQVQTKTAARHEQQGKQPLEPPPVTVRRVVQSRLVSTTSVTADGEAEKLTPTAQRCMLALREFLVSDETRPPLTVAVEAPWGGGKSSLMRHLQDALTNDVDSTTKKRPFKEEPFLTVWFNPWKHEAGKTLWAAFAVAFERQVAERCNIWERTLKRVRLAWDRLETMEKAQLVLRFAFWVGALVALGCIAWQQAHAETVAGWKDNVMQHAPWLGMIVTLWAFLKDAVKQLGSPLKLDVSRLLSHNDHAEKVDDLHRFHEDFRRLMHAYIPKRKNGKPGKAVVFIDDLDRCEAPKAAELLQSLHQMLNVQERSRGAEDKAAPGIICVLGMDREKVAAAVAAKHEKLLPMLMKTDANGKVSQENAMIFGHEFLEKFIQLTLHLPPMQGRDLDEFLVSITGAKRTAAEASTSIPTIAPQANTGGSGEHEPTSRPPNEAFADLAAETVRAHMEHRRAEERIERVSEDLDDGRVALQCARYVAPALENNPRKLKQFVNLFRLRLYLTAAMNFLDLPDRDAENLDVDPLRRMAPGKLSVHHLAKLVALELAAPSEMAAIREKRPERMFEALEAAFPADEKPLLNALVASRDVFDPEGYDLGSAALDAYFHFFRVEVVKEQPVAE